MNQLKDSSSLYLRQHADNPVDWQPWSDAAFEQAKRENKPVLLSIGYSACHWCHVMAHESFEDEQTAEVMNRLFVNIKADREERPDLDKVYQLSHQLLTGRGGGWPLTLFLDPSDRAPFFAGTYFPPQARHGLPAFSDLLEKVSDWYRDNRETARGQNRQLAEAIARIQVNQPQTLPAAVDVLGYIHDQLEASFDRQHGGFGGAPKFPQAPLLALVLDLAQTPSGTPANDMLNQTLEVMALRGLRDPVDGGFYRYCVDGDWTIPHFEKMLYDNAQLLPLYARQARRTGNALFHHAAEGIAGWLMNDMRSPQGGFHASIDADAGGVEGGYHTWSRDELRDLLGEDYSPFAAHFGLDSPPNFEGRSWHLVQAGRTERHFSRELGKLAAARNKRTKPATDRKILTSWNALAIAGLSRAGSDLGNESWIDAAGEALALLRRTAWKDGRLYAVTFDGVASHAAYLDDHAFLLDAGLAFLQARWDDAVYQFMIDLADIMLDQFEDADDGGFWFSARDQDVPMARLRSQQDDATPSGGALAASSLLRLAALSFDTRYLESARRALENACGELRRQPLAHASLARAVLEYGVAPPQVLIVGKDLEESKRWKAAISEFDRVNSYLVPPDTVLPGATPGGAAASATAAHVCLGTSCLAPVHSAEDLRGQLQQSTDGFPDHHA